MRHSHELVAPVRPHGLTTQRPATAVAGRLGSGRHFFFWAADLLRPSGGTPAPACRGISGNSSACCAIQSVIFRAAELLDRIFWLSSGAIESGTSFTAGPG